MSRLLADVLTVHGLRAQAAPSFDRGELYWRDGRVASYAADGDAVVGVVVGEQRYHTRVSADDGALFASCSCLARTAICKHAVALGLAFLTKQVSPPDGHPLLGLAPAQARPGAVASTSVGVSFATRVEADAWAAQHQVPHALWGSAETLYPQLPADLAQRYGLLHVLGRLAIRDVASREGVSRHIGVRGLEAPVAEVAYRALAQAAAIVRAGCQEETARPAALDDPALAALWARLLEVRRGVRAHAAPRSRSARRAGT